MISEVQFGPWMADQTDYKNPGLEECKNAIPSPSGYGPAYGPTGNGVTVSGTVVGAAGFERTDGVPVVCVATTSDLYVIVSGAANASSLTLTLSQTTDQVIFERYNAKIYASTKNGDVWVLDDVDTDTTFASATGSPPNANAMARVSDFLVVGDVDDGTDYPYRLQWSQFNNPDGTWGTDVAAQSGYQDMDAQHGPITAISGGTFGIVFQKFAVSRLTYARNTAVFALDTYEKNRGCIAGHSVLRRGDIAYYLSSDGFMQTDGASAQSISRGRVWDWFLENSNATYHPFVSGAIDWVRRCCVWTFAGGDTQAHTKQIWFNWDTERWGYVEQDVDRVFSTAKDGLTLEQVGSANPDLDAMTQSLDSAAFKPAGRNLAALVGGEVSEFTGSSLEAEFTTGSFQPVTGQRTFVRSVTPIIANDSEGTIISLGARESMTKSFLTSASVAIGPLGYAATNVDGRYFRVTARIPSGEVWSDAFGLQLEHEPSGAF
mgnify:CR=1 FL=1